MSHSCLPVLFLYLPTSHATHARAYTTSYGSAAFSTCVYPTLHTQAVTFVDAGIEFLLPAQDVHSADPVVFLYFPATQATHTSPVFAVYPGSHEHSTLAASDLLFGWQLLQADVPAMRLYVPAGQAWHAPAVPVKPASHWHARLPGTDTVLFMHDTHCPCA